MIYIYIYICRVSHSYFSFELGSNYLLVACYHHNQLIQIHHSVEESNNYCPDSFKLQMYTVSFGKSPTCACTCINTNKIIILFHFLMIMGCLLWCCFLLSSLTKFLLVEYYFNWTPFLVAMILNEHPKQYLMTFISYNVKVNSMLSWQNLHKWLIFDLTCET